MKTYWLKTKFAFKMGVCFYKLRLQESKWYIIPLILDIILLPVKLIIVKIMKQTKKGRSILEKIGKDVLEELES